MKALALLGLLFVSSLGFAQVIKVELPSAEYGGCRVYHTMVLEAKKGSWTGDCGTGLAEGYGRFTFYYADGSAVSTYYQYKYGKQVNPYSLYSDAKIGNRLMKTNPDGSTVVLSSCGVKPDLQCAAIVNGAYLTKNEWYLDNQKIKGSYSGPQKYPNIVVDRRTSGGPTPAAAEFLKPALGVKVACKSPYLENALKQVKNYDLKETRPCYKEKELAKYYYYYLTTLDLSCPTGTYQEIDEGKVHYRTLVNNAVGAAKRACSQPQ